MNKRIRHHCLLLAAAFSAAAQPARASGAPAGGAEDRTFFVTRRIGHEQFHEYLETARPDWVQAGNYGAMFHGYADDPRSTGWPMNLPMSGEREVLAFQRQMNARIHALGLKVIGHFRLVNVLGDWDERLGFVAWYDSRWPEDLLGPRPHPEVAELLQRDAAGRPLMRERNPGRHYLHLCLSSPHARRLLKQMLDLAIEQGVDGVISVYNYHYGCVCPYCRQSFRSWLGQRFDPETLRRRLGIESLENHVFDEIPARITGYPDVAAPPGPATELNWAAMAWAAENFKAGFDDIFISHGRSVKPDLLVGTWNHLGNVGRGEERAFLPIELWGRGEDYFWYSGGASFVDRAQDLAAGKAGDAWVAHLYLRSLAAGKPFVMGKYERVRLAMSMAEGYATGALGMGRYMNFRDPAGFETLVRYTRFRRERDTLFRDTVPDAELALLLPRQAVQQGNPAALDAFRSLGQALAERAQPFDVLVDQRLMPGVLDAYPVVVVPGPWGLDAQPLHDHAAAGGMVLVAIAPDRLDEVVKDDWPEPFAAIATADAGSTAEAIQVALQRAGGSRITAPWTVRAALYRQQGGRRLLHLVNYDRESDAREDNRGGPADERPRLVTDIAVDLRLPDAGSHPVGVTLFAPEREDPLALPFTQDEGRVRFSVPRLQVYAIIAVDLDVPAAAEPN